MMKTLRTEAPRKTMALLLALTTALGPTAVPAFAAAKPATKQAGKTEPATATPIKHLVVIFNENVSFDHYFGTYPFRPTPRASQRSLRRPGHRRLMGLATHY
jgi:phospholipase C